MKGFDAKQPIGIFDSGIGGLTVAHTIKKVLPNEQLIYFGDTAHLPYGDKSADAIRYYALKISKFLLEQNCKMIVIACNSASSAAYDLLLEFFEGKALFVNVVDPLVNTVIAKSYQRVGVIATKATIHSNIYRNKIKALQQNVYVGQLATPLLVPMIEEGLYKREITHSIIENYLSNPILADLDALLLACTHYPLIKPEINAYYHGKIDIMDSMEAAAGMCVEILDEHKLINPERTESDRFYVSDYTPSFEHTAKMFYGDDIQLQTHSIW